MSDKQNNPIAFVATSVIPESPPPARDTGAYKWVRENLFSNIPNSILTLLSLALLYSLLSNTLPWMLNGIWTTSSLAECREILDGKSGALGALAPPEVAVHLLYPSQSHP